MSIFFAVVKSLAGQVFAVSVDGLKRQIFEGDRLLRGEQVLTGLGEVTLQLANGELVGIAQNSRWQAGRATPGADSGDQAPTTDLEQALTAGFDPTQDLDAPAAGPGGIGGTGGTAGGGHSFVLLDETGQQLDATVGFATTGGSGAATPDSEQDTGVQEVTAQQQLPDITTPSITLDSRLLTTDSTPTISGISNEIGATITLVITDSNGVGQTFTTVVQPDGTFQADVPSALADGPYTISASVTDAAGNTATANNTGAIDTSATITVSLADVNTATAAAATITGTSDVGTGRTVTLVISDGTNSVSVDAVTDAAGNYSTTADLSGLADGNLSVTASVTDAAGNPASATDTAVLDNTAPTVTSIALADTGLSLGETTSVTITFSEAVSAFSNADVNAQNGTLGTLASSDGGITWVGTFTPTANITDTSNLITVANTYTDVASNAGAAASSDNYSIDTQAPTLAITDNVAGVAAGNVTLTFTFSEAVSGFSAADIGVSNGTPGTFTSVDASTYTLVVTPTGGEIAISVPTWAAQDLAGNASTAASTTQAVDISAPTVVISASDSNLSVGEISTLTFTFSEAVSGFTASDISTAGGTLSNLVQSASNPAVWTASFTQTGTASPAVSIAAGSYTDLAGNPGTAGNLELNSTPIATNDNFQLSGLAGQYFAYNEGTDGSNLTSLSQAVNFVNSHSPSATFTATTLNYGVNNNGLGANNSLQTFLGSDATSLSTDPANSSDAIIRLAGLVNLAQGNYQLRVTADDGYSIRIDGVVVAEYNGNQSPTAREGAVFNIATAGQHQIEIIYWDQAGQAELKVELRPDGGAYSVLSGNSLSREIGALVGTEDQPLTINATSLLGNDSDRDGDSLTITAVQSLTNGTAAMVNGDVVFTPTNNHNGPATFTYTVSDGRGGTATATATINFAAVNDAPVALTNSVTANEDSAVIINVLGNDSDVDGDSLTVTSATATQGTVVINANGTLTYTPNANYSGSDSITYSISDGKGGTAASTVSVSVTAVADAPVLLNSGNIFSLSAGGTQITTGVNATFDGVGLSQSNLEVETGLATGALDGFNPPSGALTNNANVNVIDGKLTSTDYNLKAGTTVNFGWQFANGENVSSEIRNGFNDQVILVVTDPTGARQSIMITSSEQAGASTNSSGVRSFTATASGAYHFDWLILNGEDSGKDSRLTLSSTTFSFGSTTYGAPIEMGNLVALQDRDGSESLSLSIAGVPADAAFTAGTRQNDGVWTFTAAQLDGLQLLPPSIFTGTLNLVVTATATESNASTASSTQTIAVTIDKASNTIASGTDAGDSITGTANNDLIHGYAGNDTLNGAAGHDILYGGAGDDTLNGGDGNDNLYGGVGADTLNGGNNNDLLFGGAAADSLIGAAGNDLLFGGQGNDTLTGGTGADRFVWRTGDTGTDLVKDLNFAQGDRIDLSDLLQGENAGNILNYLRVDTATSTLQVSTTGTLNATGSNVDVSIKLEGSDGVAANLSSLGSTSSAIVNALIAGADPLVKVDHA
ncbi:beta strand repeat-containing protein [Pseudomonas borbori]